MNITRRLILIAGVALALAACTSRPPLTVKQIESVKGLSMQEVQARLGMGDSVTNAGDSIWWEYINVATPDGNNDGDCHVVFKDEVATEVRC